MPKKKTVPKKRKTSARRKARKKKHKLDKAALERLVQAGLRQGIVKKK